MRKFEGPITCQRICILLYKPLVSKLYWLHTSLVKKISTCHKYMTIDLFLIISRYYVVKHTQKQKWKLKINVAEYRGKMCFILVDLIHLYSGWKSLEVESSLGIFEGENEFQCQFLLLSGWHGSARVRMQGIHHEALHSWPDEKKWAFKLV